MQNMCEISKEKCLGLLNSQIEGLTEEEALRRIANCKTAKKKNQKKLKKNLIGG